MKKKVHGILGLPHNCIRLFENESNDIGDQTILHTSSVVNLVRRSEAAITWLHAFAKDKKKTSLDNQTPQIRDDFECIMAAVRYDGEQLKFALEEWRDREDVTHAALSNNGMSLKHVSERLRSSPDSVRIAVAQNCLAFQFAEGLAKVDEWVQKSAWVSAVAVDMNENIGCSDMQFAVAELLPHGSVRDRAKRFAWGYLVTMLIIMILSGTASFAFLILVIPCQLTLDHRCSAIEHVVENPTIQPLIIIGLCFMVLNVVACFRAQIWQCCAPRTH